MDDQLPSDDRELRGRILQFVASTTEASCDRQQAAYPFGGSHNLSMEDIDRIKELTKSLMKDGYLYQGLGDSSDFVYLTAEGRAHEGGPI